MRIAKSVSKYGQNLHQYWEIEIKGSLESAVLTEYD